MRIRKSIYQFNKIFKSIAIVLLVVLIILGWWFGFKDKVKDEELIFTTGQEISLSFSTKGWGLEDQADIPIKQIKVIDPKGIKKEDIFKFTVEKKGDDNQYILNLHTAQAHITPGKYELQASFLTPNGVRNIKQDFYWGVLTLNSNKSIYEKGEQAYLQFGVLDDHGDTLCKANLKLKIITPSKYIYTLDNNHKNVGIIDNPDCGYNNIINNPDYYAYLDLDEEGIYQFELIAQTDNGVRNIKDFIKVQKSIPFSLERVGPTRIWPVADYTMELRLKVKQPWRGSLEEVVPTGFKIKKTQVTIIPQAIIGQNQDSLQIRGLERAIQESNIGYGRKSLQWQNLSLKANEELVIKYTFDAPDISPELYLLGPAKIIQQGHVIFKESRFWQIANDATETLRPTSNGSSSQFTPSTGSNYQCVDEVTANEDTDYVYTSAIGTTLDLYNLANTTGSGSIDSVVVYSRARVTGAMVGQGYIAVRTHSTNYTYAISGGSTSYADYSKVLTTNPYTGSAWTWTEVDSLEAGIQIYISSNFLNKQFRNTQTWVVVNYTPGSVNNAPTITSVTDSPDPVTVNKAINFSVDWNDADVGELVKAKVCKTNSLVNQNCAGGYWATSTAFTTSDPESITYTAQTADSGFHDYWAFVCDDGGLCSASTAGDFTVGPTVTTVTNTPNPIGVGSKIIFSVDWNDDAGDMEKVHICKGSGIATATQLCSDGAWANSDVFTNRDPENQVVYTTVEADKGNTRNYWAFVCDDGNACSDGTSGTFTVANQQPDAPANLLIEGMEVGQAKNIIDTTPEFRVKYKDTNDEGDVAVKYCIQVNTASDFTGTDMWVSDATACGIGTSIGLDVVEDTYTPTFSYGGSPLSMDGTVYYWRIWLWDGEVRSVVSDTGWFSMANNANGAGVRLQGGRINGGVRLQ